MCGLTGRISFFIIISLSLLLFSVFSGDAYSDVSLKDDGGDFPEDNLSYHMSQGDIIDIKVFEVDELSRTVHVDSNGNINLPLIGTVSVKGLNEEGLRVKLERLLAKRYLQKPQVSVFVKEAGFFYVLGNVNNGERFPYTPGITLQQSIAMAGGFTENADLSSINLTRNSVNGIKKRITIDYNLVKEGVSDDIPLMKNDVIFVNALGKFYLGGYVKKPGSFDYRPDMTLQQAIASAGGVDEIGKASKIRITRKDKDVGVKILTVNYNKIKSGESEDIDIKEGDIIYVPKSYMLGFVQSFFFSIGLGNRSNIGVNPTPFVGR